MIEKSQVIELASAVGLTFDFQHDLISEESRYVLINKGRGIGASSALCFRALIKAVTIKSKEILLISKTEKHAKHMMEYVSTYWYQLHEQGFVKQIKKINDGLTFMKFNNGSSIYALSSSPSAARGYHGDVYLDEFAHFQRGIDRQLMISLKGVISTGGSLYIFSTPFGESGEFWKLWNGDDQKYKRIELPWTVRTDESYIQSVLESKEDMLPLEFAQEFEGQFTTEASQPLPTSLVMSCVHNLTINEPFDSDFPRYLGVDFAKIHDDTALVGLERKESTIDTIALEVYEGMDFDEQMSNIRANHELYKYSGIQVDKTLLGIPLEEELVKTIGPVVSGVHFTNPIKERMFQLGKTALMNKVWRLPKHDEFIDQLTSIEKIVTPDGMIRYRHPYGKKDDIVWAALLALQAAVDGHDPASLRVLMGQERHMTREVLPQMNQTPQKRMLHGFLS